MSKNFKRLMIVGVIAASTLQAVDASACGGRSSSGRSRGGFGGGISLGFGGGRSLISASIPSRRTYNRPVQSHRTYAQPAYAQPIQPQPVYTQPVRSQSVVTQQFQSQPVVTQTAQPQPVMTQQVQSQSVPPRTTSSAVVSNTLPSAQTKTTKPVQESTPSALQMLASLTSNSEPTTETEAAPTIPEFTAAATAKSDVNIGTWNVSLPGNQSVQLILQDDGRFSWTARKSGVTSTFAGTYQLDGDQLTLVRSKDQQQMKGSWTANAAGFIFKIDGAITGGLAFVR